MKERANDAVALCWSASLIQDTSSHLSTHLPVGRVTCHDVGDAVFVINNVLVDWIGAFIGMHVAGDDDVHLVLHQQRLDGSFHGDRLSLWVAT